MAGRSERSGLGATRRTLLGFFAIAVATVAIAAAVIFFFAGVDDEEQSENRFPAYWSELEEGELTEAQLRERLGAPDEVDGACVRYDDLVEANSYRFCFDEQDVLVLKSAA